MASFLESFQTSPVTLLVSEVVTVALAICERWGEQGTDKHTCFSGSQELAIVYLAHPLLSSMPLLSTLNSGVPSSLQSQCALSGSTPRVSVTLFCACFQWPHRAAVAAISLPPAFFFFVYPPPPEKEVNVCEVSHWPF